MFVGKKIFVFGMARSGYEVAKLLLKRNCDVIVSDLKEQNKEHVEEIVKLGGNVVITEHPEELIDDTFDYIVKNPGIRKDHVCLKKAKTLNIPIINEVELAYKLLPKVKIIGITGSNGKTTTTTLTYNILKSAKVNVHLGGNIGYPLSSLVDKVNENDTLLLEISDHQLCDMYDFKTDISVFTNVSPTHLDFHESYEVYKKMKHRIFNHHTSNDIAILNKDNEELLELTKDIASKKYYFSSLEKADIYYEDGFIICPNYLKLDVSTLKIKGSHNYENIMACILICKTLNIPSFIVIDEINNFNGVEHRIEYVEEVNGVLFYNDSKSTNNVATITALKSFNRPIILLMGGLNRGQSYDELLPYMGNVKKVICFGETKNKINDFCIENSILCEMVDCLKEALKISVESSENGDVVLLSPAHASWDQYDSFEIRGNEFKEEVNNLK